MARLEFDPTAVGKLEVGWWIAHNEHNKARMFELLVQEHIALYGFTPDEAQAALGHFAEGVKGHDQRDLALAVGPLTDYYQMIKDKTGFGFDPAEMAKLEVGWWQIHDELDGNPDKTRLAEAFALLYATQFSVALDRMMVAGQLKAQATNEHDLAEMDGVSPEESRAHWDRAEQFLVDFYTELSRVIAS
ncbi:hypothetical protein KKC08_00600 [Patescibacteria group bacterium]|nr:hypothetical protein [Patescibacteria group bacterium]MCG2702161.1 hypothetical protein [Candidatus Parcubacteria bacterium]MBU4265355.1 hypothetical protein [Patescibacteria group bacterium]MBU4390795.1 hypothetical protein [Patescibacteria group bacterium]MBU4396654.1 hypothetical protein [Patescibacteria group bacterium]